MEFLIVLFFLLIIGGPILAGLIAFGLVGAEKRGRAKALDTSDDILRKLFAGGAKVVRYDARPYDALAAAVVIEEALNRGYTLANNDGGDLTFVLA